MSKQRTGGIFASSFVAGVLLAAAIYAPRAWEPIPGSSFEIDDRSAADGLTDQAIEAAHAALSARIQPVPAVMQALPADDALEPPPPAADGSDPVLLALDPAAPMPDPFAQLPEPVVTAPEPVLPMPAALASAPVVAAPKPVVHPPERLASTASASPASPAVIAGALPPRVNPPAQTNPVPPQQSTEPPPAGGGIERQPAVSRAETSSAQPAAGLTGMVNRMKAAQPSPLQPAAIQPGPPVAVARQPLAAMATHPAPPLPAATLGAAPLPGAPWTDPDGINWADVIANETTPAVEPKRGRPWIGDWRSEPRAQPTHDTEPRTPNGPASRILDRFRGGDRRVATLPARDSLAADTAAAARPDIGRWPRAVKLEQQLDHLASLCGTGIAGEPISRWTHQTRAALQSVQDTRGPRDAAADSSLVALGETVIVGMTLADATPDAGLATHTRRVALAVARRVAVWRSSAALFATLDRSPQEVSVNDAAAAMTRQAAGRTVAEIALLLDGIERFESATSPAHALAVKTSLASIRGFYPSASRALDRAVQDHYAAPNVRVAVHQRFLETLLPGATVDTAPFQDTVMGREVRGTRTVERTTVLRLVPDEDEICFNLEVHGDIASRAVTDSGPVSVTARSASAFTVQKPIKISSQGLLFGNATGSASNRSHVDAIQTTFDSVPVMGPLVRSMARNQQAEAMPEANREVIDKIITRACREVDSQAEPQFAALANGVRDRVWMPLVKLGLDPQAVALQTTASLATMRLRLAAESQLAAHTPRPRVPADAMLSLQVHESSVNNTLDRLGLAGRQLTLEELIRHVCGQIGVAPTIPEELPEGVSVTFAAQQPLRVECRDGLVHVSVALDAIESGRRDWYDLVAHVSYKPVCAGSQVFLEREGPVQLRGKAHEGRMELALRTIFGKIFPKERKIALLPDTIAMNPKLADMHAVQAASSDGWLAVTLEQRAPQPATIASPPRPKVGRPAEARRRSVVR